MFRPCKRAIIRLFTELVVRLYTRGGEYLRDGISSYFIVRGVNVGYQRCIYVYIYRVSQEECAILRERVPYVKPYRYNPKHLYPKLNGYGDNGQRSLKLWQLLHTYWLPNTYWNWQEYVVSVMLISVLKIKLTCEWHKAIKLNYENTRTHVIVVLRVTKHFTCAVAARNALEPAVEKDGQCAAYGYYVKRTRYSTWNRKKTTLFSALYLRNRSTLDIDVLGYIGIV